ncbi:MAG: site-specific DNA-methyltransferase, partial [Vampirovibrionia bacterium]
NGRFHSDWLSMMYSRLKLARNLLRDDGVIFISIDDNEVHNLRRICDDVFGGGNFLGTLIRKSKIGGGSDSKFVVKEHDYLLCFAKSHTDLARMFTPHSEEYLKRYKEEDDHAKFFWDTFARPGLQLKSDEKESLVYTITLPDGSKQKNRWIRSKQTFKENVEDGEIRFLPKDDGSWSIQFKQYLNEDGKKPRSLSSNLGSTIDGKNDIVSLFHKIKIFSYPKPIKLVNFIASLVTNHNDLILDFFAGSATTAHAVMKLNAEDGGNRKFILVQLPEKCDEKSEAFKAKYKTIAEISKERIRRAGKKIKEENPETTKDLDIGFRVLKVDSSNMKDTYYKPKEINQQQIAGLISNIKEDRTDEDILFQVMLDSGVQLDLEITTEEIMGKKVYFVAANSLCACFETNLPEGLFSELAKREPVTLVLKDSSFVNNDALKTNVEQIFRQLSPETELKVI